MAATAVADRPRDRSGPRSPEFARVAGYALGAAVLLVLVAVSTWERTRAIHTSFWMDEGLSVGIASHPFSDIPHLLRQDGSPPLYYLMLHVWMRLFGTTEAVTHSLSLLASLLSIPAGLWAGRALFGPRAGWICAGLCAFNPFLTIYGQETRMYSWMALQSILAAALLNVVFVQRRRGWIVPLALVLAAMLYTHGWALFFCAAAVLAVLVLVRGAGERRPLVLDGVIVFGIAGVLFLPWLPTLLEQSAHTAAPWSKRPRFGAPIQISRGLFGGDAASIALLLAGGFGVVQSLRRAARDHERQTVVVLLLLVVVTLALAWIASQITPAWTTRYFGIVLGPLLLLAAHGMAKARGLGVVALLAVFFFWYNPHKFTSGPKSDLRDIATAVRGQMRPGDIVINAQPEQVPAAAYYLGPQFRYASPLAAHLDRDPYLMDWYDAVRHARATNPQRATQALVAGLRPGQHVLLVRPITDGVANWTAKWTLLVRRRSAQISGALAANPHLKRIALAPAFYQNASEVGNSAILYEKT
jgi:mannosyltransferase